MQSLEVFRVSQGRINALVVGLEASQRLCRALEQADPYGGIPFSQKLSMSHTEALRAMEENQRELALYLARHTAL